MFPLKGEWIEVAGGGFYERLQAVRAIYKRYNEGYRKEVVKVCLMCVSVVCVWS